MVTSSLMHCGIVRRTTDRAGKRGKNSSNSTTTSFVVNELGFDCSWSEDSNSPSVVTITLYSGLQEGGGKSGLETMSVLFNFQSFLTVVLLLICTCAFIKISFPRILDRKTGFRGFFWRAARIGERLSPWVAGGCLLMGLSILFF